MDSGDSERSVRSSHDGRGDVQPCRTTVLVVTVVTQWCQFTHMHIHKHKHTVKPGDEVHALCFSLRFYHQGKGSISCKVSIGKGSEESPFARPVALFTDCKRSPT